MRQRVDVTSTTPYDELPQFLTVEQAAAHTQQSEWTIREAVKCGLIPHSKHRFGRKQILIPKEHFAPADMLREAAEVREAVGR